MLYYSTRGTSSGIEKLRVLFFLVERALGFCVIYFLLFSSFCVELYLPWFPLKVSFLLVWNYIWFTRYGIVEFCVIFVRVEHALVCGIWCYIFLRVELTLVLWNVVLYFSECGTYSCIVKFCVLFVCIWNALWYCGILCYIYLCVERALILWNFVLYLSVYGTRSGIVEFIVIFMCVWKTLWYCRILCYIFHITQNSTIPERVSHADIYNNKFHNTRARSTRRGK